MASTGKWETVGAKKSKKSTSKSNGKKPGGTGTVERGPVIEHAKPIETAQTIWSSVAELEVDDEHKENKQIQANKDQAKSSNASPKSPKKTGADKKKQQGKDKKAGKREFKTVEDAMKKLDANVLKTVVQDTKLKFPDNPQFWLNDLASMLNLKLDAPDLDPTFYQQPAEYPLSILPKPVYSVLSSTVTSCPLQVQNIFFEHCLYMMVKEMTNGTPTYGYRICIQYLAQSRPEVTTANLPKFADLLKTTVNRPNVCLSIIWGLSQSGSKDLATGLTVWLQLLLPHLGTKSLSSYIIGILENLFKSHKKTKASHNSIGPHEFFPVLDFVFTPNTALAQSLQQRLQAVYPKIKDLALGPSASKTPCQYFPSLLARATPNCPSALKTEIMELLVHCLTSDPQSFSNWRQMYTKQLLQSGVLMRYMLDNWDKVSRVLPEKFVQETVLAFSITNEEMAAHTPGREECRSACKELLLKMKKPKFPWGRLIFTILLLVVAILGLDIYTHGSFQASTSHHVLKDSGLLAVSQQAWVKISFYSRKGTDWAREWVPYYYSMVAEVLDPYIKLLWQNLYDLGVWIAEVSAPLRAWLDRKIPLVLEWIDAKVPVVVASVTQVTSKVTMAAQEYWAVLKPHVMVVWTAVGDNIQAVGSWLEKNVFTGKLSPEALQASMVMVWEYVWTSSTAAKQWIVDKFSA
ncbi:transmembrane protein 214-B-like [Branchiostoma floridae x Branchiostoma japonicum]